MSSPSFRIPTPSSSKLDLPSLLAGSSRKGERIPLLRDSDDAGNGESSVRRNYTLELDAGDDSEAGMSELEPGVEGGGKGQKKGQGLSLPEASSKWPSLPKPRSHLEMPEATDSKSRIAEEEVG
jgi:hypothetical protein